VPDPAPAASAPAAAPAPNAQFKLLLVAVLLGVPVAAAAILFTSVVGDLTTWVWTDIPKDAGWSEPPWWYVLALPTLAGLLVYGAIQLPGKGGHSPLEGLGLTAFTLREIPSVILAAMASLVLGIVLGPEAPLTAIGLCLGLVAGKLARLDEQGLKVMSFAGAFGAIASIFGGPIPSSLLLFETVAATGLVASAMIGRLLVPGLIAAGIGALLFTGVGDWDGVHSGGLSALSLPSYPSVQLVDVLWAIVIAVAVGLVVVLAQIGAKRVGVRASARHPLHALLVGGFAVGLLAVLFRAITGNGVDQLLFSGETDIGVFAAEGSASILFALLLMKGLAYAISLGSGFRGGPIFPSVALGVIAGTMFGQILPGAALTPAVIAGLAAGPAAAMRLPFFGALLATLLGGVTSSQTVPIAVIAAVVGWVVGMGADQVMARRAAAAGGTPNAGAATPAPASS
jgi:H+/Cl- antiporter ClcA